MLFDFATPLYARKEEIEEVLFATGEKEHPPQLPTKSQLNKIEPQFRLRYPQ